MSVFAKLTWYGKLRPAPARAPALGRAAFGNGIWLLSLSNFGSTSTTVLAATTDAENLEAHAANDVVQFVDQLFASIGGSLPP